MFRKPDYGEQQGFIEAHKEAWKESKKIFNKKYKLAPYVIFFLYYIFLGLLSWILLFRHILNIFIKQ